MKTITDMAREAGLVGGPVYARGLEHFAELVRAAAQAEEREACAKVCDARVMGDNNREDMEAKRCAADIRSFRARGNT